MKPILRIAEAVSPRSIHRLCLSENDWQKISGKDLQYGTKSVIDLRFTVVAIMFYMTCIDGIIIKIRGPPSSSL